MTLKKYLFAEANINKITEAMFNSKALGEKNYHSEKLLLHCCICNSYFANFIEYRVHKDMQRYDHHCGFAYCHNFPAWVGLK